MSLYCLEVDRKAPPPLEAFLCWVICKQRSRNKTTQVDTTAPSFWQNWVCFEAAGTVRLHFVWRAKRGTNSIFTGTKIAPVRKQNIPLIKNDELPTQHIQKREIFDIQKLDVNTILKKNFEPFTLITKCPCTRVSVIVEQS